MSTRNALSPVPPESKKALSAIESAKRLAAYRAVAEHFSPTMHYVGIGSGSTVVYVVEAIAALGHHVTDAIIFIPTGYQSHQLILEADLPLGAIDSLVPRDVSRGAGTEHLEVSTGKQDLALKGDRVMLDVAFDGADEVDEELNCVKGGGACLFQEKLVAISAKKFICVADFRKYQPRLLTAWPTVPIEIVPLSAPTVLRSLRRLGSPAPYLRLGGVAKAGPIVTDQGNFIVDAPFPTLLTTKDVKAGKSGSGQGGVWEVDALAQNLKALVGVVEIGLFWGRNGEQVSAAGEEGGGQKPVAAYFGMESGEVLVRTVDGVVNAK